MRAHRLWGLGALSLIFEWFESLRTLLCGPLLTAGLMIALTDLLTEGRLLTTQPELLYAWAIAMGAGLDAQLIGSSVKVGRAARTGHPWQAVLYGVLVVALSYVAFIAAQVFATQQAYGITMSEALGRLGMDGTTWLVQRSILSVVLVVLSGLLRYTAPGQATIIEERAKLERELTLEPLRAQVRMRKALGWRDVAATAFAKGPQIITKPIRSEEHTSELQSHSDLVCRLLLEKKKKDKCEKEAKKNNET